MKKLIFGVEPYQLKNNEDYMNANQLIHFANILTNWQAELMNSFNTTTSKMQMDENHYSDPNDRASKEEEFNMELRTKDRERKLLKKIEISLRDIQAKNYGYCKVCDAPIGVKRLEARPVADMCVDCKTILEKKEV